jgi:hypothetical protein
MNEAREDVLRILPAGLALGIAGDFLIRGDGPPGLNFVLWVAALATALAVLHRCLGGRMSREAALLLALAVACAGAMAWRSSGALKLLALAATGIALALPAYRAGAAWVRDHGLACHAAAVGLGAMRAAIGAFPLLAGIGQAPMRELSIASGRWQQARAIARGAALSLPLLLIFGALFVAADAVFAEIVSRAVRIDMGRLVSHVLVAGFIAWVSSGYLHGFVRGTSLQLPSPVIPLRPTIGITEVATALGLLALLFLAFVIVQFRYLFGGAELVLVTPGLSFAEYARRGFFELVAVSVLMLPLLLAADSVLAHRTARDAGIFRIAAGAHVFLILIIVMSALQRMRLYLESYGLTESRFYATILLLWVGLLFIWFAATVLRSRGRSFGFGALASAFGAVAFLHVVNPDAVIARTNLARGLDGDRFDIVYVTSLSADATPTLLAAFDELPARARCRVADELLRRWPPGSGRDWRSWSWSDGRARAAVAVAAPRLRAAIPADGVCPDPGP